MKKIFIDGGAHKGEAIEVLLDKRLDLKGCDVHFFEPNIDLIILLESIGKENKNYNINVYHSALWKEDGEIEFLESIARWNTLASTVVSSMNEIWGLKLDRDNPQKVKSVSLSNFLKQYSIDDYIVVKLDIEGSEYFVIEDLFSAGEIEKIDELYIEWHDHFFPHLKNKGSELKNKLSKTKIKINNNWM
jgi:FkbM family methyltransferase